MAEINSTPRTTSDMATSAEVAYLDLNTAIQLIYDTLETNIGDVDDVDYESLRRRDRKLYFIVAAIAAQAETLEKLSDELYAKSGLERDQQIAAG
jgi:hypothetical protein